VKKLFAPAAIYTQRKAEMAEANRKAETGRPDLHRDASGLKNSDVTGDRL
jgi:hypothetical protein